MNMCFKKLKIYLFQVTDSVLMSRNSNNLNPQILSQLWKPKPGRWANRGSICVLTLWTMPLDVFFYSILEPKSVCSLQNLETKWTQR